VTHRALFVPPFDELADPALLAELARDAERAGWDGVFLWDHLVYADPVQAVADPWICLAAMGAATSRLTLGAMVTPLPRRRPVVLARQAATLDLLTGGRLVLGFGLGDDGRVGELSRFGEQTDPRTRARMLDEGLALVGRLLTGDTVDHHGEFYTADDVRLLPRPHDGRHLPVWIAGRWPHRAPLRRAAAHDGAFVIGIDSIDQVQALVDTLRHERGDLDGFDVVLELPADADPDSWTAVAGVTWLLTRVGPYDVDLAQLRATVAAGPGARA
jgi:alkanesulfonate monooxygenase SsuD/methylene tetrahydromethanopterin reductase-like flavin-dependent oxidoreductase (luciferase family)